MTEEMQLSGPPPLMGDDQSRGRGRGRGGFRGRGQGGVRGGGMSTSGGDFRGGKRGGGPGDRGRGGGDRGRGGGDRGRGGGDRGRGGGGFRGRGRGGEGGENRGRGGGGFRGGRGGQGQGGQQQWSPEDRFEAKMMSVAGPTFDLPSSDQKEPKKFTNKCRLFVGNLTEGTTLDEFTQMFQEYGETTEPYLNPEKAFGFIKLDYRENAEKARQALNGIQRNGRILKVRFSAIGCTLKVKRLSPWVSNELLDLAFSVFGELERAVVIVDERGKSTGTGILEYAKKPCAANCLKRCTESSFFLTESLQPVEVEVYNEEDTSEGLQESALPKRNAEYQRERSIGPRLAMHGSFEMEYGNRWKQLYELQKQRTEQLDQEMQMEGEKLRDQMELARREHETEMLREQLRQREEEQQQWQQHWQSQQQRLSGRQQLEDQQYQRRQEMVYGTAAGGGGGGGGAGAGTGFKQEDPQRQQQEQLFMRANELNAMLDQVDPQQVGGGAAAVAAVAAAAGAGGWGGDNSQQGMKQEAAVDPSAAAQQNQPYTTGGWANYGQQQGGMGGGRGDGGRGRGRGGGRGGGFGGRGGYGGGRPGEEEFPPKRQRLF